MKLDKGFLCIFHSIQNATNFLFIQKLFYIFDCFFPFLGIIVWTSSPVYWCMYLSIMYKTNILQCIIIQTSHHMLCIVCINMNFFIAKADKMEDSQDLWSTNKATTGAILYLFNIFRQFLKLDSSFPKIKNMIIHKLGFQHCEKKNIRKILVLKKNWIIHELPWCNSSI